LILEAGGWDLGNHLLDIPGYTDKIVLTHMDWQYFTVPQKYSAFAMEDNVSNVTGTACGTGTAYPNVR